MTTDHRAIVAQLRELMGKATPGPVHMDSETCSDGMFNADGALIMIGDFITDQDEDLFVALHNALPALLARLERLEAVAVAAKELHEVAILRGDNYLPQAKDDPLMWNERMQDARLEMDAAIANLNVLGADNA